MVKKRPVVFKILIYLVILVIIVFLIYSYFSYKKSLGTEEGETFVICDQQQNCVIALHGHAEVDIKVCGEEVDLHLETGDLSSTHTHKERNLIHIHERLKYDNSTQTILQTEPITMKSFFNHLDVSIRFNSNCIADKCNGDLCNGNPGTLKFYINDIENNEYENYIWKDHDKIKIIFE